MTRLADEIVGALEYQFESKRLWSDSEVVIYWFLSLSKVAPIIKCTCTLALVSLITLEIFQLTHRCRYQFVGVMLSYDGYVKHKGNNATCDSWDLSLYMTRETK